MIKLVRYRVMGSHAPVVAKSPSETYRTVTDAQGRYRFLGIFPDNDARSCSAGSYRSFPESVVVLNGPQQGANVPPTMPVRRVGLFPVQEQARMGRALKGDFGHLFGAAANLQRGRRVPKAPEDDFSY